MLDFSSLENVMPISTRHLISKRLVLTSLESGLQLNQTVIQIEVF